MTPPDSADDDALELDVQETPEFPRLQWLKAAHVVDAPGGTFCGFGIPQGEACFDRAMTEARAQAPDPARFWRPTTIAFANGNHEAMWIRAGIEVIVIAQGVQTLSHPAFRGETERLWANPAAPLTPRLGSALGWAPQRRNGALLWDSPTRPQCRTFHRTLVLLKDLPHYPAPLQLAFRSTLTDNIVAAFQRHLEVLARMKTDPQVVARIKAINAEAAEQLFDDPRSPEAAAFRQKLPIYGAGLILADGGLQAKGSTTTAQVAVPAAYTPAPLTTEWMLRRLVAPFARAQIAQLYLPHALAWSTDLSRRLQLLTPDEQAELQRRRYGRAA